MLETLQFNIENIYFDDYLLLTFILLNRDNNDPVRIIFFLQLCTNIYKTRISALNIPNNASIDHHIYLIASLAETTENCIPPKSVQKCEPCLKSEQCMEGMKCGSYQKKCVNKLIYNNPRTVCYFPIAECNPRCFDNMDPYTCSCKNEDFPDKWAGSTCQGN